MKRKKNGFTFVELMAVIVVIGIVLVLVVPSLIGNMGEAKEQTEIVFVKNIDKSINNFIAKHKNEFKVDTESEYSIDGTDVYMVTKSDGNNYRFSDLKSEGIKEDFVNPKDSSSCDIDAEIELYRDINFKYYYRYNLKCLSLKGNFSQLDSKSEGSDEGTNNGNEESGEDNDDSGDNTITNIPGDNGNSPVIKKDNSGANAPDLDTGLVPVRYNGTNWVIIDPKKEQWYDYDKQEWANAVSLAPGTSKEVGTELKVPSLTSTDSDILAMFVWIPRYNYTIGCHENDKCYGYRVDDDIELGTPTNIYPGAIDIEFVSKDYEPVDPGIGSGIYPSYNYNVEGNGMPAPERNPDNWYTHPAFTFGDKELSGIWVGKFETGINPNSNCYKATKSPYDYDPDEYCLATIEDVLPIILPNSVSLANQNIYNQFKTAQKFSASENIYGIDNTKTDGHMAKNSEWAAVAYLSQSIYGKYGNKNYKSRDKIVYGNNSNPNSYREIYTGRSKGLVSSSFEYNAQGTYTYDDILIVDTSKVPYAGTGASTTGNIYGIYDMNGGASEYVMGNYNNNSKSSGFNNSWFITEKNLKYYDNFTTSTLITIKSEETIGQNLAETNEWYGIGSTNLSNDYPWLTRNGLFSYGCHYYGNEYYAESFRSVLVSNN